MYVESNQTAFAIRLEKHVLFLTRKMPVESTQTEYFRKFASGLYKKGLVDGLFSDVTIKALGKRYNLHRIVLVQNPYFASMLEGPWSETRQSEILLTFDDPNITVAGLEIVFKRKIMAILITVSVSTTRHRLWLQGQFSLS